MKLSDFSPFEFSRLTKEGLNELTQGLDHLIAGRLWVKIIIALVLGIGFGFVIGPETNWVSTPWSEITLAWLALPGQLFLGLIQIVVIPLVFASVVLGIVSGDNIEQLKSLGLRIGAYYLFTTIVAIGVGLAVTSLIRPGVGFDVSALKDAKGSVDISNTELPQARDFISQILPSNPFQSLVSGEMLQIVLLALFMGVALMSLKKDDAKPMIDLLNSLQKISMTVIGWAMRLAPIAIFALTARLIAQLGLSTLIGMSYYVLTVIFGLSLIMIFYLLLITLVGQKNPWNFLSKVREVQLLAFSTSSSASVMPMTIDVAQNKLGVKPSVAQFVVPLGATVNMDGTAMYQGVATLFLAQIFGVDLSMGQMLLVISTATMSSIGAPGAPGVGMAVLSVILANTGIPSSGIILILGVDRILDMCRTVINVTGDLTAAIIMNRYL